MIADLFHWRQEQTSYGKSHPSVSPRRSNDP
jgi:hypothetical protein